MEWNSELSEAIARLYRYSAMLELTQFRSFVFETAQALIDFDSAMWMNISEIRQPIDEFDTFLFNQAPEMIQNYSEVVYELGIEDQLFEQAVHMEGQVVAIQAKALPELYERHCRPFGLEQGVTTVRKGNFNGVHSIISLYRSDELQPFSEQDKNMLQWLAPHFIESFRQNLIHSFKNTQFNQCYNAISDRHGVLIESETGFVHSLGQHINEYRLTAPILENVRSGEGSEMTLADGLNMEVNHINGLFHLQVAKRQVSVELSPRQQQLTAELVSGAPDKIIANKLNISLKTVRNQLSAIYKKLQVRGRAEAIALLLSKS